jgi:fucose permease
MKASKILQIAEKKLSYSKICNQLGASLTPAEVHALIDAGYEPSASDAKRIPNRKDPNPRPNWFYFKVKRGTFHVE